MSRLFKISFFFLIVISACDNFSNKTWQGECADAHDIGTIEIIPALDNNTLRVIFKVETAQRLDTYIRYWEATDSNTIATDSLFFYSPLCKNQKNHELMIVNLKSGTKYNFNVVVQNERCKTFSKTYEFTTKQLPAWIPYYLQRDSIAEVSFDGYMHFHSRKKPGYMYIVNNQGEVVWYKNTPFNIKVSTYTQQSTFLTILSNDTLKFSSGNKIAEIDLFGQLVYRYDANEKGSDLTFHHEINFDEDGNIMTLTYDERIVDLSEVGGNKNDTVRGDGILIMDKQDNVVWNWSVFDVMKPTEYSNILNEKKDWLHANALCDDSVGNYYVSFRNNCQIWKIDGKSGSVIWKLGGDDGDFGLSEKLKFYGQHNVHLNEAGNLVLLDNGNRLVKPGLVEELKKSKHYAEFMRQYPTGFNSRLLTLKLDEEQMKAELVDEVVFPSRYFTKSQGSSSFINDSLFVFCSTNTNRIVFTDSEGEKTWALPLEYSSYRAQYIPEFYKTDYVK